MKDAAEMYPVPAKAETQGRTEIALGKWLKSVARHNVVVATKVRKSSPRTRTIGHASVDWVLLLRGRLASAQLYVRVTAMNMGLN